MDYPLTQPGLDLYNGKFTDGVPGVRAASVIPSITMNALIDELKAVIAAGGLTAAEGTLTQLRDALKVFPFTTPTATTPAQFDASTKLATTAWVAQNSGRLPGQTNYNVNTTLGAADIGKAIVLTSVGAPLTMTLPAAGSCSVGSQIPVLNLSGFTASFVRQGADTVYGGFDPSNTATSFPLANVSEVVFVACGNSWMVKGSGDLKNSYQFQSSLAANGYQKLPSGVIFQWGNFSVAASSTSTFSFPVTFATACYGVTASFGTPASGTANADFISASQYRIQNTYTGGTQSGFWWAFGK